MAAVKGTGAAAGTVRELGKFTLQRPGAVALSEAGSVAGAEAGREMGGETGAMTGAVAGGVLAPGAVTATAKRAIPLASAALGAASGSTVGPLEAGAGGVAGYTAGKLAQKGIKAAGRALGIGKRTPQGPVDDPLLAPGVGPENAQAYAEEQIAGELAKTQSAIETALGRIAAGPAANSAVNARRELEHSYAVAQRMESRLWNRTPKKELIPVGDLKALGYYIRQEVPEIAPAGLPAAFIDRIQAMGARQTVGDLIALRSELLRSVRAERALAAPNDPLIRNMLRLAEGVAANIADALPDDVTIKQARAFSTELHDLFTRGPIGQVLRFRTPGDPLVSETSTVQKLLSDSGYAVKAPGKPTEYGGIAQAKAIGERLRNPALIAEVENTLRGMFQEAAAQSPAQAQRLVASTERSIKPLAKVANEFKVTAEVLQEQTARKLEIERSALAKYAQQDSQVAINRVFASTNPAATAKELTATFNGDPDAIAGFRNGIIHQLLQRSGLSGRKMLDYMSQPKIDRMLQEALDPGQYHRLNRIATMAEHIERGDEKVVDLMMRRGGVLLARIFGAQAGRMIAHMTGGGTVQTPGIVSGVAMRFAENTLRGFTPQELVANAIRDPYWERVLMNRVPQGASDLTQMARHMRRLIGLTTAIREAGPEQGDE
jgi:plasmid stabilization system protein ParE